MRTLPRRLAAPLVLLTLLAGCDAGEPVGPAPDLGTGGTPARTTDQIVIRLDMQPDGPQDVRFQMTGAKRTNILLDDDSDPTLANLRVVPSLKPGTYQVAMDPLPSTHSLVGISCVSLPNGGSGVNNTSLNLPAALVSIGLEALEQVTCTFTVVADLVAPTVTIEAVDESVESAGCGEYATFAVVFSEPVTGFDASDIAFSGGAAAVQSVTGDGIQYSVVVQPLTPGVALSASVPAGAATDAAGNPSEASTSTDNTVQIGNGFCTEL